MLYQYEMTMSITPEVVTLAIHTIMYYGYRRLFKYWNRSSDEHETYDETTLTP